LETIEVPAGRFQCRQVKVEASVEGPISFNQTAWIEEGGQRRILKFDAGQWGMELSSSVSTPDPSDLVYRNSELGIDLALPEGWYAGSNDPTTNRNLDLSFLTPRMEATATLLTVNNRFKDDPNALESIFDGDYAQLQKFFTDYQLREGTKSMREINGMPAVTFIADYVHANQAMVEYRCYYVGEYVHWFVFRVQKDQLETYRSDIETMIEGFKGA